jgi:hypothetical protein
MMTKIWSPNGPPKLHVCDSIDDAVEIAKNIAKESWLAIT